MRRTTFKILFIVYKSRVRKDGKAPINVRVTINGSRGQTPINAYIKPQKWNAIAEKSLGNTRKDDEINARIDTVRLRLMQIYREIELERNFLLSN